MFNDWRSPTEADKPCVCGRDCHRGVQSCSSTNIKVEATRVGGGEEDARQQPELGDPDPAQNTLKQAKSNSNQHLEVENEQRHNEDKDVEEYDDEDRELEAEEEGEKKKKEDSDESSGLDDEVDDDEEEDSGESSGLDDEVDDNEEEDSVESSGLSDEVDEDEEDTDDTDDEDGLIAMASTFRPSKAATRIHRIPTRGISPPLELLLSRVRDIVEEKLRELDANFEKWLNDDVSNLTGESFEWSDMSDDEEYVPDTGTTAEIESAKENIDSLLQQGRAADALRSCLDVMMLEMSSRRRRLQD